MEQPVDHTSASNRHYILLAYRDENQWNALPVAERAAFQSACLATEQALWQSGYLLAAEDHQDSLTTITVRVVNGKLSLSEGPFVSAKGPLVELYFIQARDLNEAIQVAAQMPQAYNSYIEVRPMIFNSTNHPFFIP